MRHDVGYLLYWDDDAIPIDGNMTLGNHLDNDVVVPGEDVQDFHVRIDLSERGPVAIPLGDATVNVNGREQASPVQVIIGDVLSIGQVTMQIGVEVEQDQEVDTWALHADEGEHVFDVIGELSVGRDERADINVHDEHISRFHARIVERHSVVWVQDLGSANGTRVNGTPVIGGVRLFHGDEVAFDRWRFQLIGKGPELTPVALYEEPLQGTSQLAPNATAETTVVFPAEEKDREVTLPAIQDPGTYLVGMSSAVAGKLFRVATGQSTIGRSESADMLVDEVSVSNQHARVTMRAEGTSITNLMSTNGTKVNGEVVTSATLKDGDVVRIGRVSFMFREIRDTASPARRDWAPWAWIAGAFVLLLGLLGLMLY